MDNWLNQLIRASNGRAFTEDEAERVTEYAESLPVRLSAAAKVQDAQKWLTRHLGDAVGQRASEWALPREPLAHDFVQAINPIVTAMLLDDKDVLGPAVIHPFESLAAALDIPASELAELFQVAWSSLCTRLDPPAMALLQPYFERVIEELKVADLEPALVG